jgi:tetratricopeptide (TPR) repeat protein
LENVRLAWSWAALRGQIELIREAALGLFLFYDIRSRFQEGAGMFARAGEALRRGGADPLAAPAETKQVLGLLLTMQGWFWRFSDPVQGHAAFQEGMAWLEPLGPSRELVFANVLFVFACMSASRAEALERLESSLSVYQAEGDRWGIAVTQEAFCGVLCGYDNDAAEAHIRQSLQLRRQLGDRWGVSMSLYMWGWVAEEQGRLNVAKERYQQSLDLRRELGEDVAGAVGCLNSLGRVARKLGDYAQARERYLEGLALSQEMGDPWFIGHVLANLGRVAYDLGEHDQASHYFEQAEALQAGDP